ncbi:MAG: enoyl-CoA hydratase/isomerase family protein, partial [Actinobacteria bacterium]|nr:enoyl-CoA hydratase/isomerase family protein [Actinomycetota bacterium]
MLAREVRDGVAWLRIDRPERRNAIPAAFWGLLRETSAELAADEEVRAVVLHGAGDCFSVGADITDFPDAADVDARARFLTEATTALEELVALPLPTVAAVHGHCIGGGLELTLACDIVVADATARFSAPEARVGLVPGVLLAWGRERIGDHWLRYLALSG